MNHRRVARIVVAMLVAALMALPLAATGQVAGPALADPLPDGVSWQALAAADAPDATTHTDAMLLHRIAVECGQATGEIPGPEQLTWVEYG